MSPQTGPVGQGPVVIVLAAGEGQRMHSVRSKVLHTVGGHSLLRHTMDAVEAVDPRQIVVVVGYQKDEVAAHLDEITPGVLVAVQESRMGTGDAVRVGLERLEGLDDDQMVVVMYGDLPLLQGVTVQAMVGAHRRDNDAATVLAPVDDDEAGAYVFDFGPLHAGLESASEQGHYALADVVAVISESGRVGSYIVADDWQTHGVDDRLQLASVAAEYNRRQVENWMRAGVTVVDPGSTWIEADVDLAADVTLLPGVQLMGATSVAVGATIGPDTTVKDSEVGERAVVTRSTVELSVIGDDANVGPYARLRPGTQLGARGVVGTFVETKNTILGLGARLGHLVYCGDATLGDGVDVGAGVVFANWDSTNRARIVIGDGAVIGAGSLIVPPASVEAGAVVPPGMTVRPVEEEPIADEPVLDEPVEPRHSTEEELIEAAKRGLEEDR